MSDACLLSFIAGCVVGVVVVGSLVLLNARMKAGERRARRVSIPT